MNYLSTISPHKDLLWLLPLLILLMVWEVIWKLIALWKAGRRNHLGWFIFIGILNTAGILPIIYLLIYRQKSTTNPGGSDAYLTSNPPED